MEGASEVRHGSLFSGIGGFDLAAEWMGWENVFQVEIDPFCQKVLEKNFPDVTRYGDIKQFDGTKYRGAVDIITGGFPCQTFSLSGKGAADITLWKQMFRIVGEAKPKAVVAENVYGLLTRKNGMVFDCVCTDLESEGYEVQAYIIPACSVGAWHERQRVWIVANLNSEHSAVSILERRQNTASHAHLNRNGKARVTANAESQGLSTGGIQSGDETQQPQPNNGIACYLWDTGPIEPLLGRGFYGVPNRVDRIKSLGNAIVPQVAYEIFKAINKIL